MFFNSGCNRQNIGIENYILGLKSYFINQDIIRFLTDFNFSFKCISLTFFIERHNYNNSPISFDQQSQFFEPVHPFLKGNWIYHSFALEGFQSCFNYGPLGWINHNGQSGNIWFWGNQVQKLSHGEFGIKHAFIHIHIYQLGTSFYLLPCNVKSLLILILPDQASKFPWTGHVGTFTNIHKICLRTYGKWFEATQIQVWLPGIATTGRDWFQLIDHSLYMFRRGSTTSPNNIQEALTGIARKYIRHKCSWLVIFTKFIGQASIGVNTDRYVCGPAERLDIRPHHFRSQAAIQPNTQ